ncbi:TlpA family protein disulfide reductase [Spiribacter halobius]|uniref:Redoxin n=1 Tax=Sediminicurvatus halobius TaxID=2182432 RepID=A0A2U2N745_9GAMM|nr:TlpA disulfide reductase family protein [Spiribacter halobius]PWG64912.1 redoxin [Spiribacter halobius]UEX78231.1 TlpA family protein disulfide reductase [Spiribacter halobius]
MSSGLRLALLVLLAAVLGAGGGIGGVYWYQQAQQPETVQRPAFSLPDLAGDTRSITEWDGRIVVLNFWATWCAPCREEIPLFTELQARYGDEGVQFLGVAIDRREAITEYLDRVEMGYPTLYGMQAAMDVAASYDNHAGTLPYTVIIDRDGDIRHYFRGQVHREDLQPILAELVRSG